MSKPDAHIDGKVLSLVIRALKAGVWEYDIDTDSIKSDRRWYDILGIDPVAMPVSSVAELRPHIHPADVAMATEVDLRKVPQLLAEDNIYHVDFRILRSDGEIRWVRSVASLISDAATSHRKAIGCITDVTDLRCMEAEATQGGRERGTRALQGLSEAPTPDASVRGGLTAKEWECLRWVSVGKTATESAVILGKSRRTIEFHLKNAVRKLNATNKIHAAALAIRLGII